MNGLSMVQTRGEKRRVEKRGEVKKEKETMEFYTTHLIYL